MCQSVIQNFRAVSGIFKKGHNQQSFTQKYLKITLFLERRALFLPNITRGGIQLPYADFFWIIPCVQHIKFFNSKGFLFLLLQKNSKRKFCPQLHCLFHQSEALTFSMKHIKSKPRMVKYFVSTTTGIMLDQARSHQAKLDHFKISLDHLQFMLDHPRPG